MNQRLSSSANAVLWLGWIAVGTASAVIAWYGSYAAVDMLERIIGTVNEDYVTMPILVAIIAAAQAAAQWLLLRHYLPHASRWAAATVAGWIVACVSLLVAVWAGGFLREVIARPETALYAVAVIWGLGIGGAQWLVLRRYRSLAGWWVPASVIAWLAVPLVIGPTLNNVQEMAAFGAVPAAITGIVLVWLLRQPPHETGLLPRHAV